MSGSFDPPIVAYTERDSIDPVTCEEGKLRCEWAVVSTSPLPPDLVHLRADCPSRARDWSDYALIARYVRRGKIEPWSIIEYYDSEIEALEDIETGVVPVDLRLVTIFREREWAQRVEEALSAARFEKALKREAERLRVALGARAYGKLVKGGRPADVDLCERWNAFTSDPENVERRDELAKDEEFMKLYNEALYSDRVPEKRKTLKEFLKYAEVKYGWKMKKVVKPPER